MKRKISLSIVIILAAITGISINVSSITATGTSAGFEANAITVQTGQTFYLTVVVNDVNDLYGCQSDIEYNSDYLELVEAVDGAFLSSDGAATYFVDPTMEPGKIQRAAMTRLSCDEGVDGSGEIVYIFLRALKKTSGTTVSLKNIMLVDRNAKDIDKDYLNSGRCRITISDEAPVFTQPSIAP